MKLSRIQQIIKEEVAKAVTEADDQKIKDLKASISRILIQPISTGTGTGETKSKTLDQILSALEAEIARFKSLNEAEDEFGKAMDNLKKQIGFTPPTPGGPENKLKTLSLEKLPNYDKLPNTEKEVKDSSVKIFLYPHIRIEGIGSIFSKEKAQEVKKQIQDYWTENNSEPLFTYKMEKLSKDEYTNEVTFAKLANGNKAFKKSQRPGPGPETDLSSYYDKGPGSYTGD